MLSFFLHLSCKFILKEDAANFAKAASNGPKRGSPFIDRHWERLNEMLQNPVQKSFVSAKPAILKPQKPPQ